MDFNNTITNTSISIGSDTMTVYNLTFTSIDYGNYIECKINNVLSNSFGFGGTNVSLIFTNLN